MKASPLDKYSDDSYGDLLPVMKIVRELGMQGILRNIAGDYADIILVSAINRVIRPESMKNLLSWFEDTCLSAICNLDLTLQLLSGRRTK